MRSSMSTMSPSADWRRATNKVSVSLMRRFYMKDGTAKTRSSFRGAPTGPREARPDDRLRASPELITPNRGYGFPDAQSRVCDLRQAAHPGMTKKHRDTHQCSF